MGLLQNIPHVFSFLLILTLSLASSRAYQIEILNNCTYTVWAAANPGGGMQLKQGETWTLDYIIGSGRIWGRTKCVFGPDGRGRCESGDCDGRLECEVDGRAPNTLAEYSIDQNNADQFISVSVVEGFNIPMEFSPAASSSSSYSECIQESKCAADVNVVCPMELRDPGGCNNPCTVFGNNQFCCTSGNICEPTSYSKFFKDLCPDAFTFPYDFGQRSTCPTGTDYKVVFCPKIASHSAIHKKAQPTPSTGGDVGSIITRSLFDQMLKYRNDPRCPAKGSYTYDAFINAARSFNGFGTTGDDATRKKELAAFFGQTSHETTGGWPSAPNGPYAWGYCFVQENGNNDRYRGRGPIQLTYDYNYNQAGKAIGVDLINNPDLVATDPVISFKTAVWFWMTPQGNKPSSHNVIIGRWTPSDADRSAGRVLGYGVITNIINGGLECGKGQNDKVADRIGFYRRYCDILGVSYGNNLDCYSQQPFA